MSEETLDTSDNHDHHNHHELHQDTSLNQPQIPRNSEQNSPKELPGLNSCEGTSATGDDNEQGNDMEDLPNCVEVHFVERKNSEAHLNCVKVRTVSCSSSDRENAHLNSINVRTVISSSNEADGMDLNSAASTESLSSAKDVLNNGDDSGSNGNLESLSVDLPHHWERTQSEQDYESIPTCRICHCDSEGEPLISPCLCTGTVKHVHHSCLMDWLKRCVKTKCELCLQPISVDRKTKPLKQWRRPGQKPTPIIWLLTFVVALTLNIASIAKDGSQKCVSNPCIIFYVVGAIGALLGFAFFYHFLIVSIRYIKQWMALNEDWTLAGLNKSSELGNANLGLSDKSLGVKEQRGLQMVEIV